MHHVDEVCTGRAEHQIHAEAVYKEAEEIQREPQRTGYEVRYEATENYGEGYQGRPTEEGHPQAIFLNPVASAPLPPLDDDSVGQHTRERCSNLIE